MNKTLGTTCKVVGATVLIGVFVVAACLFSENSRTCYATSHSR